METNALLWLVAGFQAKHFICDGPLQTAAMVHDKGIFLKPLGLIHAGWHALGSSIVIFAASSNFKLAFGLGAVDLIVHYFIDFTKENIVRGAGWSVRDAYFWWALSLDQLLHHLTYLALVYVVTR